ncbi:hypothetical protein ACFL35_05775 [Candidatus Riflebacteria bacterium]
MPHTEWEFPKDLLRREGLTQVWGKSKKLSKARIKKVYKLIKHTNNQVRKAAHRGDLVEVEQAFSFVEGLPRADQKLFIAVTGDFRGIHQEIKFRPGHNEGSEDWKELLERIERLGDR